MLSLPAKGDRKEDRDIGAAIACRFSICTVGRGGFSHHDARLSGDNPSPPRDAVATKPVKVKEERGDQQVPRLALTVLGTRVLLRQWDQ